MSSIRVPAACVAAILLAACATGTQKQIDYQTSDKAKSSSLEVPPDLVSPSADPRFAVPEASRGSATLSTYGTRPQQQAENVRAQLADPEAGIRVARAGSQRWLVVPGTPQDIWPKLRSFWLDSGFSLLIDSPSTLVMETDWAENRAAIPLDGVRGLLGSVGLGGLYDSGYRDRFRTRVEPSNDPGKVEIYISHRGAEETFIDGDRRRTAWQMRPNDPNLEAEMLVRLMMKLGAKDEAGARNVLAAASTAPDRAQLSTAADGAPQLVIKEPFERGWRQVGLSLDRVGLVVEDRDRAKGHYLVRYVSGEDLAGRKDEGGFWSKLAFWRDKKASALTGQYRIAVSGDAQQTVVRVQDANGAVDRSEAGRQIITILHEQLK